MTNLRLISTFIFLIIITGLTAQTFETDISSNFEKVSIFQNGRESENYNDTVYINRDTFEIVFSYKKPINFLVNASATPESFDVFYNEPALGKIPGFSGTGIAEGLRNDSLGLTVSSDSPNAWFYDDEKRNRFDKNEVSVLRFVSTRTIENLVFHHNETISIEDSEIGELYLCIVEYEYKNGKRNVYGKKRIKIVFD